MKTSYLRSKIDIHREHIKIFILLGLIILILILIKAARLFEQINLTQPTRMGVSYSPSYAKDLGLDPKQTYLKLLQIGVRQIRLAAYWDEIEPEPGQFDFSNLDTYINEARDHQAKVLLVIGYKLPRWPECRAPKWLDQKNISLRQSRQLLMLKEVINRYNYHPTIYGWQLENEPLFPFGSCPKVDEGFLRTEVAYVRSLTKKPLVLSDSGELSSWKEIMELSDYFGTTLYRTVHNPTLGLLPYPLKPWFYSLKSTLIRKLFAPSNKKTIITELQTEPWTPEFITQFPLEKQVEVFPPKQFQQNVDFAKKVGFEEIYLWGAEWWYWMKLHGRPEYWDYAKKLFSIASI